VALEPRARGFLRVSVIGFCGSSGRVSGHGDSTLVQLGTPTCIVIVFDASTKHAPEPQR